MTLHRELPVRLILVSKKKRKKEKIRKKTVAAVF